MNRKANSVATGTNNSLANVSVARYSRISACGIPFLMFVIGFLMLYLRSMDPFLNPIVYTEDGVWIALGLDRGWLYALANAKPTYFVFINIFLLYLSTEISVIFSGNPLTLLPQGIAIMSGIFYSVAVTLAFVTFRRIVSGWLSYLAFSLLILMPMGISMNIIVGRLSQIGFFIPLIVVCLLFWRSRTTSRPGQYALDVLVLLCAGTNPLVFALCGAWFGLQLLHFRHVGMVLKNTYSLVIPLVILFLFLIPKMGADYGMSKQFNGSNLIEALIGRTIVYPFMFPWYSKLSNAGCVVFFLLYVQFVRSAYKKSDGLAREFMRLLVSSLVIYNVAAIVMRPGLTGLLSRYQVLTADQYFFGVNALVIFLAALSAAQYFKPGSLPKMTTGLIIVVLIIYAAGYRIIFEGAKPVLPVRTDLSFSEQVCASESLADGAQSVIKIYFPHPTLVMVVPSRYIDKSTCAASSLDGFVKYYADPVVQPTFNDEINIACLSSIDDVGKAPDPQSTHFTPRQMLNLRGWLARATDEPRLFDQTLVTLTDAQGRRVFVSTRPDKRRDVAQAFQHRELAAAGFKSAVGLIGYKGTYTLGLAGISESRLYVCSQFAVPVTIP